MKLNPLAPAGGLEDGQDFVNGLWTIDELASFMRLSRKAAYALVAGTNLPRVRIGVRLRFQPQAVHAWVKAHACESAATPRLGDRGLSSE
jgi:excisionase family DNA binding protein